MEVIQISECPACGKGDIKTAFRPDQAAWDRFALLSRRKYQGFMDGWQEALTLEVGQCLGCGHYWHRTQPDFSSLIGMYQAGISLNQKNPARAPDAYMLDSMRKLYSLGCNFNGNSLELLDYGSGRGRWSRAAMEAGFHVTAYEPSVVRANEGEGGFLVVNDLEELRGRQFDVVNLEQVLEHVQEPDVVLKGLFPYLKPDALLRISVPDISRIKPDQLWKDFPFDGSRMHILSPYEHLQGFTPRSLRALLARAGFTHERDIAVWRTHPMHMLRWLLGPVIGGVATTHALVRPDPDLL